MFSTNSVHSEPARKTMNLRYSQPGREASTTTVKARRTVGPELDPPAKRAAAVRAAMLAMAATAPIGPRRGRPEIAPGSSTLSDPVVVCSARCMAPLLGCVLLKSVLRAR